MRSDHTTLLSRVERAITDLKSGRTVAFRGKNAIYRIAAPETIFDAALKNFSKPGDVGVLLTAPRAKILGIKSSGPIFMEWQGKTAADLMALVSGEPKYLYPVAKKNDAAFSAMLELMKIAELLPAALITRAKGKQDYQLNARDIAHYQKYASHAGVEVCRAPLFLKGNIQAEIRGYRFTGAREHYAIIVGNPDLKKAPRVRVHSSCYTGDLLGSLACDCQDQLHGALKAMAQEDGGILLYLMQEGRGIGLVNKLRTYALQHQGKDTVDANHILGFEDDERPFDAAIAMLKKLGVKQVRLLSNNPRKGAALTKGGVKVVAVEPLVVTPVSDKQKRYLSTKKNRLGHIFK